MKWNEKWEPYKTWHLEKSVNFHIENLPMELGGCLLVSFNTM